MATIHHTTATWFLCSRRVRRQKRKGFSQEKRRQSGEQWSANPVIDLDALRLGDWLQHTDNKTLFYVERLVNGGVLAIDTLGERRLHISKPTYSFRKLSVPETLALATIGLSKPFKPGESVRINDGRNGIIVSLKPSSIKPPKDHAFVMVDERNVVALPFADLFHVESD